MRHPHRPALPFLLLAAALGAPGALHAGISFVSGVSLPNGGEIVSFDKVSGTLLSTNSATGTHLIQSYALAASGTLAATGSVDLNGVFGGAANIASVTSVFNDARGFGIATIVPTSATLSDFGRVAFFDRTSGAILSTVDVGYHPDSVTLTPDGNRVLIANEGEYGSTSSSTPEAFNRPGSVSVINLSGVTAGNYATSLAALNASHVSTIDFSAGNLASGVTLAGTRNNRLDTLTVKTPDAADIEPEYIVATNTTAYVTLQENNAVATLDLTSGKYTAVNALGSITQTIDASDRDGAGNTASAARNDTVAGLPMPDTVVRFERAGATYLATANEGDARPDDKDIFRAAAQNTVTNGSTAPDIHASLDPLVNNTGIGRLNILKDVGDTNGDGVIDTPTMMGTRSASIWKVNPDGTLTLVFDTGAMIEQYVLTNDPASHNINSGSLANFDTRSDDKGPEPEALAFGKIGEREYLFVGAERQNGIFQFDITDLNNVFIEGYFNPVTSSLDSGGAFISPESITFLAAADNPTGQDLLVVGFEGTGGNGSVGVFSVSASAVPEPSTYGIIGAVGALALARLRRRNAARAKSAR